MNRDQIIHFIDVDEARQWAFGWIDDFNLKHLFYPKIQEFSELGLYCLFNNK